MRSVLLVCTLLGCVEGPGEGAALPTADFEAFVAVVQPILAERCANPSCHGRRDRPLALYAAQQHRADHADLFLEGPLNEPELRANYVRTLGFLYQIEALRRCALLSKPLAPSAGGSAHVGGAQFEDRSDQEYQALSAWVEGTLRQQGVLE